MIGTPFSPWPCFTEEEAEAVAAVLRSEPGELLDRRGRSPIRARVRRNGCGSRHAVALMNGTVALDVALKALGVGPGDEVVVTPRSFIASASLRGERGRNPGLRRCRSRQRQHLRRNDRSRC